MNRSLKEVLALVKELRAVYEAYQAAAADGKISAPEALAIAGRALGILAAHQVTVGELQELLVEVAPLLTLGQ